MSDRGPPLASRMSPTRTQIVAAAETLSAAGFTIRHPVSDRLQLLTVDEVRRILVCGEGKAREIVRSLPRPVMLPGGDLRARACELEAWLDARSEPRT